MVSPGPEPAGVLVVDKPAGPTSHDVVDHVRRVLGVRRVGHTGTLDPFATGVLPVCVGRATRLVRFLSDGSKTYRATVRLGFATTTDDATGQPLGPVRPAAIDAGRLARALERLTGALEQVPPVYSAKRIAGERAYTLARRGGAVAPRAVRVVVARLTLLSAGADRLELEVECSPGTYVRALARDLGQDLGVGGHLEQLRRTRSGPFGLDQAVPLASVDAKNGWLDMSELLTEMPAVRVGSEGAAALAHGRELRPSHVTQGFPRQPDARYRVLGEDGALLALAVPRGFDLGPGLAEPSLHPDVVLVEPPAPGPAE